MELTELVKDYVVTKHLSKIELDFLEAEHWEALEHISELNTLTKAPNKISKELKLTNNSSWLLCCAKILDFLRPLKSKTKRSSNLKNLIKKYNIEIK